jgi:hypothetical protein
MMRIKERWMRGAGGRRNGAGYSAVLFAICLCLFASQELVPQASTGSGSGSPTLLPKYQENETVTYTMRAINEGHEGTIRYDARAGGVVKKDASGVFFEELAWSDVHVNGQAFPLPAGSQEFRQRLSLSPEYKVSIPDLSKSPPILIGPITDLLTFYVDMRLAMKEKGLVRAGDHAYFKYGVPSSWADGTYTVLGQSAVDFDLTLQAIDAKTQVATLVVRHVPPPESKAKLPADWMLAPVGNRPNNWVEVQKKPDGKYSAEVGQETYDVNIKYSLATGKIISATMDNPVEVMGRDCDDLALTVCGVPIRYRIRRQITLDSE